MRGTDGPENGEAKSISVSWAVRIEGQLVHHEHWNCSVWAHTLIVWAHTLILWENVSVNTAVKHSRKGLHRIQPNRAQGKFQGKTLEEVQSLISAKRIYCAPSPTKNTGTFFPNL